MSWLIFFSRGLCGAARFLLSIQKGRFDAIAASEAAAAEARGREKGLEAALSEQVMRGVVDRQQPVNIELMGTMRELGVSLVCFIFKV